MVTSDSEGVQLPFEVTIEDVLGFIGPDAQLYTDDSRVFIRELIQNAMDAIAIRAGLEKEKKYRGTITVSFQLAENGDLDNGTAQIVVADNGIGLDDRGLCHLAHPLMGVEELFGSQLDAETRGKIFGRFGAGLLSVFKVSDWVTIETKAKGATAHRLTLFLRRDDHAVNRKQRLKLQATLSVCKRRRVGTTVTVRLGSTNEEVDARSKRVNTPQKALAALRHYVRHPPEDVSIVFKDHHGTKTPIEDMRFHGENLEPRRYISEAGIEGCLAFGIDNSEPAVVVCLRGILVRDNYLALLPPETVSVVGEINLLTTRACGLKPSREEFLENDRGFKLLRKRVEMETRGLMEEQYQEWLESCSSTSLRHKVRCSDDKAKDFLRRFLRNRSNPTVLAQLERITFPVRVEQWSLPRHLSLPDIEKRCRELNKRVVYVHSVVTNTVAKVGEFDNAELFESDTFRSLHAFAAVENGDIVVSLEHGRENDPGFAPVIQWFFAREGLIRVVDIRNDSSLGSLVHHEELHGAPDVEARVVAVPSAKSQRCFRDRRHPFSSPHRVFLNKEHPHVKSVLENLGEILADPKKRAIYNAYVKLLRGRINDSVKVLESLLMRDDHE